MTNDIGAGKQELLYYRAVDLWKRLCEMHSQLFDLTCDEYSLLLQSNLDELEPVVKQKQELVDQINAAEKLRREIISDVNNLQKENISNVKELLQVMKKYEEDNNKKLLHNFNTLLIDIIERIQQQNKRNQMFLNKAISSLREMREEAMGTKTYATYTSSGEQATKSINV